MSSLKVIDEWLEKQKKTFLEDFREVKLGGKGYASVSGKFIVMTSFNSYSVISSESLETIHTFSVDFKKELSTFRFLTPDHLIFIANDSKRLLLYSLVTNSVISEYKAQHPLSSCIHIQSPELFWVASRSNLIQLQATLGEAPKVEEKISKSMKTASVNDITGNQKVIIVGTSDKSLVILSIKSLSVKKELKSIHSGIKKLI